VKKRLIVKEKLQICIIKDGKISRKVPEDFERIFLQHYMKSNGWTVSGAAFAGCNDIIIWRKEEENKGFQDLLPRSGINPEILSLIENTNLWLDIKVSVVVKTNVQYLIR